jgi:hypothetical protein
MIHDNDPSNIEDLVELAIKNARQPAEDYSIDHAIEFVRQFVSALKWGSIVESDVDNITLIYQCMYACETFRILFVKAYIAEHERMETIDKLKRMFEM